MRFVRINNAIYFNQWSSVDVIKTEHVDVVKTEHVQTVHFPIDLVPNGIPFGSK